MSVWAACSRCEFKEMIPDDLPDMDKLRAGGTRAREHSDTEHFELIAVGADRTVGLEEG